MRAAQRLHSWSDRHTIRQTAVRPQAFPLRRSCVFVLGVPLIGLLFECRWVSRSRSAETPEHVSAPMTVRSTRNDFGYPEPREVDRTSYTPLSLGRVCHPDRSFELVGRWLMSKPFIRRASGLWAV